MSAPISARNDGSNYVHAVGPDVCKTPMGSGMVPVPYMSIAFFGSAVLLSRTVRNNGKKDFQLNTRTSTTLGHEPGIGKGVVVPGYRKHSYAKRGSRTVFSEGWAVVRDGDPGVMNRPNPGGTVRRHRKSTSTIRHV